PRTKSDPRRRIEAAMAGLLDSEGVRPAPGEDTDHLLAQEIVAFPHRRGDSLLVDLPRQVDLLLEPLVEVALGEPFLDGALVVQLDPRHEHLGDPPGLRPALALLGRRERPAQPPRYLRRVRRRLGGRSLRTRRRGRRFDGRRLLPEARDLRLVI